MPEVLQSLTDKNLLVRAAAAVDEPRYFMLETIHEYALEQLRSFGEEDDARRQHAQYYLALAEEAGSHALGRDQAVWLGRLELEHDNVRAALRWSLDGVAEVTGLPADTDHASGARFALRLSIAMHRSWYTRGYFAEGQEWLTRALHNAGLVEWDPEDRSIKASYAKAMDSVGWMVWAQGDYDEARRFFESGLALSRTLGDKEGIAHRLNGLAIVALDHANYAEALASFEEGLALARQVGDSYLTARTLNNMAGAYRNTLDYVNARRCYEESLQLFRESGDTGNVVGPLINLALVSMDMEDYPAARRYQEEALLYSRELGHKENLLFVLGFMGQRAVEEGDIEAARRAFAEVFPLARDAGHKVVLALCFEGAAMMQFALGRPLDASRFWACAATIRQVLDVPLPLPSRPRYEHRLELAREAAGAMEFESAWAEGQSMPLNEAVEYALEVSGSGRPAAL